MGLRFRKSVSLGGFRINFSKSGIGYSYGVKGFRRTKKATGGTRQTFSIPGTGVSYVKDSSKSSISHRSYRDNSSQERSKIIDNEIKDTQSELAKKLQRIYFLRKVFWAFVIIFFINLLALSGNENAEYNALHSFFFVFSLIGIIVLLFFIGRLKLDYSFNEKEEISNFYAGKLTGSFLSMCNCQISAQLFVTRNSSDNIGITKSNLTTKNNCPYVKSNLPSPQAKTRRTKMILLPDFFVVFTNKKFHAISYLNLSVSYEDVNVPLASAPTDSEVIRLRYLRETKKGERDLRYKENPLFYECAFGGVHLQSDNGLDFSLIFSNKLSAKNFVNDINDYKKLLTWDDPA